MNFSIKLYKGKEIRINPETRYVCLTDMADAGKKLVADWRRLKNTREYLAAFSSAMGIPIATLLFVGSSSVGTWAHPKVAIRFAQWCSNEFAIQVDFWIDELLTKGKVELTDSSNKPETPEDMQVRLCPGSRTNRFYDRGNERHMVIFDLITPKTVDEDGLSTVFYKYQGDNGKGYALLETHSIDTGKRLYTLYASSDNYEGRMELYYFAKDQIDYMGIDCDDYSVQLLSKTGKPQKEILKPLDRLTIDKKFLAKSSTQEEALSSSEQLMVKEKSLRDLLPVLTAEEEKKEQRFRFYKNMFENKNNNV